MPFREIPKREPDPIFMSRLPEHEDWDEEVDSIHISEIADTGIETWEEFLGILMGNTPTEG